jgi:hypothetical protein
VATWKIAGILTCFRAVSVADVPVNVRAPVSSFIDGDGFSPVRAADRIERVAEQA